MAAAAEQRAAKVPALLSGLFGQSKPADKECARLMAPGLGWTVRVKVQCLGC